jgi:DNA-binding MarR family transcriptional regulator
MATKPTTAPEALSTRWGRQALLEGFTALPNVVVRCQKELELEPIEFCILAFLASFWWTADVPAHPSKDRIAKALGLHRTTVRRHLARLETKGFLKRERRKAADGTRSTNSYLLNGLVEKAEGLALRRALQAAERSGTVEESELDARGPREPAEG